MERAAWIEPPAMCALTHAEIHFWRADLAQEADKLSAWESLLSPDEVARAERFVFARDRTHYVCARGILRTLLGGYLETPPTQIHFAYTAHGKPYVTTEDDNSRLQFNVTHSGELALYAFNWDGRVGIDVERVRADITFRALMESIFTPRERATIDSLPEVQARHAFFTGWARKEAFIKARGEGLSYPLHQFEVSLLPHEPFVLRLLLSDESSAQWTAYALDAGPHYTAAAVSEGLAKTTRLYHLSSHLFA